MPQLGLFASTSSATPSSFSASIAPLGFPTRIKITSSSSGFTDNLLKVEDDDDYVIYEGSNSSLFFGKTIQSSYNEILIEGATVSTYPSWTAGATSIPRTGWQNGFVVAEANPISVTITATTPQTFTYNATSPSISFSNNISLASNYFLFNPVITASAGTRSTIISLGDDADYVASNSPSVSYTINKKNVTIALTSQSSTYATNQTYSALTPVAITSLSGADTISGSFGSLLTGVPATGADAGSYTISLNPSYTSTNYNITNSPASITWTISKANQNIGFNPTLTGINGETQTLLATTNSGLSATLSVVSGPATLAGSTLTYTGTGNVVVRASQAGNTNYNPATNVDQTIVVSAPSSGLTVASTTGITISGNGQYNGTYERVAQGGIILNTYSTIPNDGSDRYAVQGGHIYRKPINQAISSFTYDGVLLIPPNVSIRGVAGSSGAGVDQFNGPYNYWILMDVFYDEYWQIGNNYASNSSTNATSIPTSGWVGLNGYPAPTITVPVFPNTTVTTAVLISGNGPYEKTTAVPTGFTFSGFGNIYYLYTNYDENFAEYNWLMYSGSTQTATATGGGGSINLLPFKWYILGGMNPYSNNTFSISLLATNTGASQTAVTIPFVNWSNNSFNNSITDYTNFL